MTLTELRYIVTLAQEQHFGKAADRCNISQPTLSVAVKKLEDELHTVLFERSKTQVSLTPIGEKIIAQAQVVLEQALVIKDITSTGKNQLNSPLKVGAIFTIGPYLFPNFIPELQKIAPKMPLYIEEGYTATLRRRLIKGELDVIIVSLPFTETNVVAQPLYKEPFVVSLPAAHPLVAQDAITAENFTNENVMLLGPGHCFRDQILETYPNLQNSLTEDNTNPIRIATEGSSLETLRHMVASGIGITILPESAAISQYTPESLITRPLANTQASRTVALAWRASFPRHKAVDALRKAILNSRKPPL